MALAKTRSCEELRGNRDEIHPDDDVAAMRRSAIVQQSHCTLQIGSSGKVMNDQERPTHLGELPYAGHTP
jgi:hypothetical protein